MFLKLMKRGGGFEMVEARRILLRRHPEPVAVCNEGSLDVITFTLEANAFILNEAGDTIETFFVNGHDRKEGR